MNRDIPIENNILYHIYNRGNNRERIFRDKYDYIAFIKKMKSLAEKYTVEVPVYTLMPNHFHLIARQVFLLEGHLLPLQHSLSRMIGALQTSAAKRYNLRYSHIGHLFQGPFRYKPVSENSIWDVACYIHLNPVRAGLAKTPEKWKYSNFAEFLRKRFPSKLAQTQEKETFSCWQGYTDYVQNILKNEYTEKELWKRLWDKGNFDGNL